MHLSDNFEEALMRKLGYLLLTLCLLVPATIAASSPAHAYTCAETHTTSYRSDHGVSEVNLTFHPSCSDGKAHWSGTLTDTLCDARGARFVIEAIFYNEVFLWTRGYNASNGCGSTSSFSGSAPALTHAGWLVRLQLGACNATSCATYTVRYLTDY
jgi:hypothetical protein